MTVETKPHSNQYYYNYFTDEDNFDRHWVSIHSPELRASLSKTFHRERVDHAVAHISIETVFSYDVAGKFCGSASFAERLVAFGRQTSAVAKTILDYHYMTDSPSYYSEKAQETVMHHIKRVLMDAHIRGGRDENIGKTEKNFPLVVNYIYTPFGMKLNWSSNWTPTPAPIFIEL